MPELKSYDSEKILGNTGVISLKFHLFWRFAPLNALDSIPEGNKSATQSVFDVESADILHYEYFLADFQYLGRVNFI